MKRIAFAALAAALSAWGCTQTGIICGTDEVRCGQTCANLSVNPDHCGACGVSCPTGLICSSGACACPEGFATCGQSCVNLATSANNCGVCGNACPSGQFCVDGGCGLACPSGFTVCGADCVDTRSDPQNCGGCPGDGGAACAQGQACHDGVCESDLYASCFNSGGVYALDGQGATVSPQKAVAPPAEPSALAFHGRDSLAVVDELANTLYTFDVDGGGFASPSSFSIGQGGTDIAISGDMAAVINAQDNSLDLLRASGPGWQRVCPPDAGSCTASVHFDPNSSPEYAAFTNGAVYVTLQGDITQLAPSGNQLARVSLDDLSVQTTDLSQLDLQMPDAGTQARPNGVAVGGGRVYVALANLPYSTFRDGPQGRYGPGLIAVLDEVDGGAPAVPVFADGGLLQPIALGQGCFNAGAVLLSGQRLYVLCGPTYMRFSPLDPGALAALDIQTLQPAFAPQLLSCPGDAGACRDGAGSRMALADGKLYIGDINDGRLFTADPATGQILRGPTNPLLLCPAPDGGFDFISDVVARP